MDAATKRALRIAGFAILTAGVVGAASVFLVRDQIVRQRRNLFDSLSLKRMAALEHMARQDPSVDHITLLKDYISWEPRKILRNRARAIVERMEQEASGLNGSVREARP
ncbi:MAG: hypothetical protein EA422_06855 [Gemmatimonadales bacterium]|nr:MAG: hypothetical protein EA422_06855 [Gemmatimonadales bacterium]